MKSCSTTWPLSAISNDNPATYIHQICLHLVHLRVLRTAGVLSSVLRVGVNLVQMPWSWPTSLSPSPSSCSLVEKKENNQKIQTPKAKGWKYDILKWAASSEFGTYRICEQRRFMRACASAQSRQNLRCSLIRAVSQEEPTDRKPDPWPLWMAEHAQLKFVMTKCSKTQTCLTRPKFE